MARYFDVHPHDPQPRALSQLNDLLRQDGLIAFPSDSGYILGCLLGNRTGLDRIKAIRQLDDKHHYTLMCADIGQAGQFVILPNPVFRAMKGATPGPYTLIVQADRVIPRRMWHPKKRTVGVRIPANRFVQALLKEVGEPLLTSTLILPGETAPMTEGWFVKEELDSVVDAVVDTAECGAEPTTVVDLSEGTAQILRVGAGDPTPFEA